MPTTLTTNTTNTAPVINAPPAGVKIPIDPITPPVPASFSAADIEHARQQEKDKLYATQQSWEDKFATQGVQLAELLKAREADVKTATETATTAAEAAAKAKWEESDSKTLVADVRAEFEKKLADLESQRSLERETFAKERSFNELRQYTQAKVSEALSNNAIAPELAEYITGNNTAEIDASLVRATATTEKLLSSIAEATAAQRQAPRGVSPTGYAPVGPMDTDPSHKTYSAQDIKDMPMEEYIAKRKSFLGAAANSARDRGMFG